MNRKLIVVLVAAVGLTAGVAVPSRPALHPAQQTSVSRQRPRPRRIQPAR